MVCRLPAGLAEIPRMSGSVGCRRPVGFWSSSEMSPTMWRSHTRMLWVACMVMEGSMIAKCAIALAAIAVTSRRRVVAMGLRLGDQTRMAASVLVPSVGEYSANCSNSFAGAMDAPMVPL
jgi:hypothetical protein